MDNARVAHEPATMYAMAECGLIRELKIQATTENCHLPNASGKTPLMCAASAGKNPKESHVTCADLLLSLAGSQEDRKRMANATDQNDWSCLHHAAAVDNVGVARKLLLAGASVNGTDIQGMSALAIAVTSNSARTADLLLRAGADPLLADKQNESPLSRAQEVKGESGEEMKMRLERWLPNMQIPADFQEVKKDKRVKIGDGDFSIVYDVQTKPADLNVVLRVLRNKLDERTLENERRGLEALKKVRHANIVQLIKHDENPIEMFFEKIEGKTMEELLSGGPFVDVQIQKYFCQLASALCYLHNHPRGPIIHRDIKCDNIMLTNGGIVKMVDFGIALPLGTVNSISLSGTFRYMAPELFRRGTKCASRQSDMWSVGCVLYAMTVGHDPYDDPNDDQIVIMTKVSNDPVPEIDPPQISAEIANPASPIVRQIRRNRPPKSLCALYKSCMEKEPSKRITAVEMLLHDFLNWNTEHDDDILLKDDIREWARNGKTAIAFLEGLVRNINESYKAEVAAKVGIAAVGVAGGITAIVGFALLIPSFGAALPIAIFGISVATAGGVGTAAADVAGNIVQRKEFEASLKKLTEFKQSTQTLVQDSLKKMSECVMLHVEERRSAINLADSKVLIEHLKNGMEEIKTILEKTTLPKEQKKQLEETFRSLLTPVQNLLTSLTDVRSHVTERTIERDASIQFNRALQKAVDFLIRTLRLMFLGSVEPSEFYLAAVKSGLRACVEISSAAVQNVLGRIFGVVGSAVFTAVDIGFLAYYSVKLHRAKDGANAEKADPIVCQIDIFKRLLREVDQLDMR